MINGRCGITPYVFRIEGNDDIFDYVDPMEYARDLLTMEEEGVCDNAKQLPTHSEWTSKKHPSIDLSKMEFEWWRHEMKKNLEEAELFPPSSSYAMPLEQFLSEGYYLDQE